MGDKRGQFTRLERVLKALESELERKGRAKWDKILSAMTNEELELAIALLKQFQDTDLRDDRKRHESELLALYSGVARRNGLSF